MRLVLLDFVDTYLEAEKSIT